MGLFHSHKDEVDLIHGPEEEEVDLLAAKTRLTLSTDLTTRLTSFMGSRTRAILSRE